MPGPRHWLIRATKSWADYWPAGVVTMGELSLTVGGVWLSIDPSWPSFGLFGTGVLVTVGGRYATWRGNKRLSVTLDELDSIKNDFEKIQYEYAGIVEGQLALIASQLQFTSHERVTLYRHNGQHFTRLGRFSLNTLYAKPGRPFYDEDEGCVGEAWRSGKAIELSLASTFDARADELKDRWGIKKQTSKAFKMPSRCYVALRLPPGAKPTVVIVVESTEKNGLNASEIEKVISNDSKALLALIDALHRLEPSPSAAKTGGF